MGSLYEGSFAGASEAGGQVWRGESVARQTQRNQRDESAKRVRPVTRINGRRIRFRELAQLVFPHKTDVHLAFHARVDARTARRWLADGSEPPAEVLAILLAEIMRCYGRR